MHLHWEPLDHVTPTILVIRVNGTEVARVQNRHDGKGGWASTVARHRRDYRRRPWCVLGSQALAMRMAERWLRAHWDLVQRELPYMVPGPCGNRLEYPECNPAKR